MDQYLYRSRYVKAWDHQSPERRPEVTLTIGGTAIPLTKPSYIKEEVMYWRKANAIHQWFVDNVQGGRDECQTSYVSHEALKQLNDLCKQVLAEPERAAELLPTQGGFFFGGLEYDEWYFNDLRDTVKVFDKLLANPDDDLWSDYEYQSSW